MLILASASPRRQELLRLVTDDFTIITSHTDESTQPGLAPDALVRVLALRKARAVADAHPHDTVLGADTIVALESTVLGKPADAAQAAAMLRRLSGREHSVYTGVAICSPQGEHVLCEKTLVRFHELSDKEIARYAASDEPLDKAGGYGIQGAAAIFVSGITGDYYNVVGLPVCALSQVLHRFLPQLRED